MRSKECVRDLLFLVTFTWIIISSSIIIVWGLSLPSNPSINRRTAINTAIASPFLFSSSPSAAASVVIENPNPRAITTVRLNSPNQKAGLELYDIQIGTPPRNVVAVKSVNMNGQGARDGAERGMILLDYANREDLIARLSSGVYPIEIRLFNLALGGDSIGDLGRLRNT